MNNVKINVSAVADKAAFLAQKGQTKLILTGTNELISSSTMGGIEISGGAKVTIDAEDFQNNSLLARGYAGIHTNHAADDVTNVGIIQINNGTVKAEGIDGTSGIGYGTDQYSRPAYNNIIINGGEVYGRPLGKGTGIGGGWLETDITDTAVMGISNIEINGGYVHGMNPCDTASYNFGIGGATVPHTASSTRGSIANITINGGTVVAQNVYNINTNPMATTVGACTITVNGGSLSRYTLQNPSRSFNTEMYMWMGTMQRERTEIIQNSQGASMNCTSWNFGTEYKNKYVTVTGVYDEAKTFKTNVFGQIRLYLPTMSNTESFTAVIDNAVFEGTYKSGALATITSNIIPTAEPTAEPTLEPTATPTAKPTAEPTAGPSVSISVADGTATGSYAYYNRTDVEETMMITLAMYNSSNGLVAVTSKRVVVATGGELDEELIMREYPNTAVSTRAFIWKLDGSLMPVVSVLNQQLN